MTISATSVVTNRLLNSLVDQRSTLSQLESQLASGKRAETYGELGRERSFDIAFRNKLSTVDAFQSNIQQLDVRLQGLSTVFEHLTEFGLDAKAAINPNDFVVSDGKSNSQVTADLHLRETLGLLNTDIGGRFLFSGRSVDVRPVVDFDTLFKGDGANAGFDQVLSERKQADLGTGTGRTTLGISGTTVTLAEDAVSPFGIKLGGTTSTLSNVTITGPSGSPASLSVDFTGQPQAGETIRILINLPDGSSGTIELTASDVSGERDSFLIGATAADTASNFEAALREKIESFTATELAAASTLAASEDFFATGQGAAPQRVDGPPFDSATALRDGSADTVQWYAGDNSADNPRDGIKARIDSSITVSYGTRANEDGLRVVVQSLAAFAAEEFTADDSTDQARYHALASRIRSDLSFPIGGDSPQTIYREIAAIHVAANNAHDRHTVEKGYIESQISKIEDISTEEVVAQILATRNRLEASYRVAAVLSELTLTKFV